MRSLFAYLISVCSALTVRNIDELAKYFQTDDLDKALFAGFPAVYRRLSGQKTRRPARWTKPCQLFVKITYVGAIAAFCNRRCPDRTARRPEMFRGLAPHPASRRGRTPTRHHPRFAAGQFTSRLADARLPCATPCGPYRQDRTFLTNQHLLI